MNAKSLECIALRRKDLIHYTEMRFASFHSGKFIKVEKILKGSLDLIPSPSPSVKIQIMGGKVCLMCKDKTLLDVVNKLCRR